MLAMLATAVLATTAVEADPDSTERAHHELTFGVDGGLSVGLPVLGWAGGGVRYRYRFDSGLFLGALGALSLGPGMLGPRANLLFGFHLIERRRVDWELTLYAGWPLVGVQSKLEVFPLRFQHFEASLGARASRELLFNAEGDLFVKLAVPVGGWVPSVRVAAEAGVGVRSGLHLGPTLALQLAREL